MKGMYISQEFFLFKFHVLFISLTVVGLGEESQDCLSAFCPTVVTAKTW